MPDDIAHMRAVIELAAAARDRGDDPFAARIVAADGRVLAEAGNAVASTADVTAHAEILALRHLGSALAPALLGGATIYTSAEPCAMCAGAIAWSGIGRVVFALDATQVRAHEGLAHSEPGVPGREVLARSGRGIRVEAGLLAEEAARRLWRVGGGERSG